MVNFKPRPYLKCTQIYDKIQNQMSDFVNFVFNIELSLAIGMITSFILGCLLFLIKVPQTDYSKKLSKTKNIIAICFLLCSVLFGYTLRYSGIPDYDIFSSLMLFVMNANASAILSYSLINLLDESYIENDKFYLSTGLSVAFSFLLINSFWWENHAWRIAVMVLCLILFLLQCILHIVNFDKVYKKSVRQLELYYDEEEDHKIRWIRFCYVIMMLTQMFILVYMLLPRGFMKIYAAFYSLFLLYFTANFISFLGSHKLLLDAFAYRTLSGQEIIDRRTQKKRRKKSGQSAQSIENDEDFVNLQKELEEWVRQKRYKEYDKSREEIARELHTSKETLQSYFMSVLGMDFKTWRTNLRIEEAKRLLLERKELSTNIIGEMSGFSDRSNFHRQFVKIVGCSPKEWRESDGNPNTQS